MIKPTAQTIVKAALETLREEGFAGASSRAIARRGGFNQALIFYHYGSVEAVLLAAVRQLSEARLARYREVVAPIEKLEELVPAMADLWKEDEAEGHVRVVAQVIAGSANRPELARQVVEQTEPWIALAYLWSAEGDLEQADEALRQSLDRAPRYADLHYQRGLLDRARGDTKAALRSFRAALRARSKLSSTGWRSRTRASLAERTTSSRSRAARLR